MHSTHTTRGRLQATATRYGVGAVFALGLLACASTAHAQGPIHAPEQEAKLPAPAPAKKYAVEAVKFTAVDESGRDWAGSDEPYWIFSSVGRDGTSATRHSREFSNVDSGDVRKFAAGDRAVFPQTGGSAAAPGGIGLSIQVWEADGGDAAATVSKTSDYFKKAGAISVFTPAPSWVGVALGYMGTATSYIGQWLRDDMMGSDTFAYTKTQLDARLPSVGSSFTDERYFHNGPDYRLTLRVRRTA
jgi:hypothetical protein